MAEQTPDNKPNEPEHVVTPSGKVRLVDPPPPPGTLERPEPTAKRKYQKVSVELSVVRNLIATGHSDEEICLILGINRSTWWRWRQREEVQALYRDAADHLVTALQTSLYRKAMGVSSVEREYRLKKILNKKGKAKYKMMLTKETKKQLAPDTLALIFSLKNKDPENWKDRSEVSSESLVTFALADIPDKETAEKLKEKLRARLLQLRPVDPPKPPELPPAPAGQIQ